MTELILFLAFGLVAVVSAIAVVLQRNPVYSALALIGTFFCMAGLFVLLQAELVAAIQVIVYAGAIMVLFLFVIMLLDLPREEGRRFAPGKAQVACGVAGAGALLLFLAVVAGTSAIAPARGSLTPEALARLGNTQVIGALLFTDYLFPFEVTSVVLLIAIVGALVLARPGRG
jgi:NADH-quinone oxidoreductase subunit J